jgi:hypothetical protein
MRRTSGFRSAVWLLLPVLVLVSCFNERSPKKPGENTGWVSPTEPSILIENLQRAVTTLNLNNYRRCLLAEQFRFRADPSLQANNLGLFASWTWDNENQFFNNLSLFSQPVNPGNSLTFSNVRIINANPDSLEYTADYSLSVYHQDTRFQAVTFGGLASFQMKRNRQNEWQIVSWQDNKTRENPCWTELRQYFFAP